MFEKIKQLLTPSFDAQREQSDSPVMTSALFVQAEAQGLRSEIQHEGRRLDRLSIGVSEAEQDIHGALADITRSIEQSAARRDEILGL